MLDVDRQGFLDPEMKHAQVHTRIGIVGLSGGGSHIVQLLAHNGFLDFVIYDPKSAEEKHLRRIVGMTRADIRLKTPKVEISKRVILGIEPEARIKVLQRPWQQDRDALRTCDLIFGAVDTFMDRRDLEVFARQHLIPYIDVGMAVRHDDTGAVRVAGQVFRSISGQPCMWCVRFLRKEMLNAEGTEYGGAGPQPQVVNVNAILAGAATWMGIELLTAKTGGVRSPSYLLYDGNVHQLTEHPYWSLSRELSCHHFSIKDVGVRRPTAP